MGADIGFLAVLHSWGQNLQHHPHLHCVVPGGGLSPEHDRWIPARDHFLLPVKVLSRVFRGKFLAFLRTAFRKGKLQFHGRLATLGREPDFDVLLNQNYGREWVVYTKPSFGGPEQVLRYLSHYTHRVAISNHRILSIADGNVTFRWKDYAYGNKKKKMTLTACEFLRRFFLHVLPQGFVRIRHFGFLANRQRKVLLKICRQLLDTQPTECLDWTAACGTDKEPRSPGLPHRPPANRRTHGVAASEPCPFRFFLTMLSPSPTDAKLFRPLRLDRLATGALVRSIELLLKHQSPILRLARTRFGPFQPSEPDSSHPRSRLFALHYLHRTQTPIAFTDRLSSMPPYLKWSGATRASVPPHPAARALQIKAIGLSVAN